MSHNCLTGRELIVNYLPQDFFDEEFSALFSHIGPLEESHIARHMPTHYSLGFGFVTFDCEEDAQTALEQLNGFQVGDKRIKVAVSMKTSPNITNANLYVTNLPENFNDDDLLALFKGFGQINQRKVITDKESGKCVGGAFVRFMFREDAEKAIEALNGIEHKGKVIIVKVAEDHGKAKADVYKHYMKTKRPRPYPPILRRNTQA